MYLDLVLKRRQSSLFQNLFVVVVVVVFVVVVLIFNLCLLGHD